MEETKKNFEEQMREDMENLVVELGIPKDILKEETSEEKIYHTSTFVCDKCGKVLDTVTDLDGEVSDYNSSNFCWLNTGLEDPLKDGVIFAMTHKDNHLCNCCKDKLIDDVKEALYNLGFRDIGELEKDDREE